MTAKKLRAVKPYDSQWTGPFCTGFGARHELSALM